MDTLSKDNFKERIRSTDSSELHDEFYNNYNELKKLLYKVFSELLDTPDLKYKKNSEKLQNIISNINDKDLLEAAKLIQKLSRPEYNYFLNSIEYPTLPIKEEMVKEIGREAAVKEAKVEVKLTRYIKDIVYAFSIYTNHTIRNYYSALCAHIAITYSERYEDNINIYFRYKSPKELMIKLAKIIFVFTPLTIGPDGMNYTFSPKSLYDIFGIKIVPDKNIDYPSASDEKISNLIEEQARLVSQLNEFYNFRLKLERSPEEISIENYLEKCFELLVFRLKNTIDTESSKLEAYIKERLGAILQEYKELKSEDSLNNPYQSEIKEKGFNFQHWLNVCRDEISHPLTYHILNERIETILMAPRKMTPSKVSDPLYVQDYTTQSFKISICKIEHKNTESAHRACHYDIKSEYGPFEVQGETPNGCKNDSFGPVTAHGLMPNKLPPEFDIPPEIKISESQNVITVKDYFKNSHSFDMQTVKDFKDRITFITPKTGMVTYNPYTGFATVTFNSSEKNLENMLLELPRYPTDDTIQKTKDKLTSKLLNMGNRSTAILKILFSDPQVKNWGPKQIQQFLSNNSSRGDLQ